LIHELIYHHQKQYPLLKQLQPAINQVCRAS
jgi:hypothetical protein